jgi:hypothetical protein
MNLNLNDHIVVGRLDQVEENLVIEMTKNLVFLPTRFYLPIGVS